MKNVSHQFQECLYHLRVLHKGATRSQLYSDPLFFKRTCKEGRNLFCTLNTFKTNCFKFYMITKGGGPYHESKKMELLHYRFFVRFHEFCHGHQKHHNHHFQHVAAVASSRGEMWFRFRPTTSRTPSTARSIPRDDRKWPGARRFPGCSAPRPSRFAFSCSGPGLPSSSRRRSPKWTSVKRRWLKLRIYISRY